MTSVDKISGMSTPDGLEEENKHSTVDFSPLVSLKSFLDAAIKKGEEKTEVDAESWETVEDFDELEKPDVSPTKSTISSDDICPKTEDTDSTCRYADGPDSQSQDDVHGSSRRPRPNTAIIHEMFPDNLLAKACAEIARKRPENPIRYLAFYLMNHEMNRERNCKYAAQLEEMMDYKKSLEADNSTASYREDEVDEMHDMISSAEELNFEVENEENTHNMEETSKT